jgi:hypothetical protein
MEHIVPKTVLLSDEQTRSMLTRAMIDLLQTPPDKPFRDVLVDAMEEEVLEIALEENGLRGAFLVNDPSVKMLLAAKIFIDLLESECGLFHESIVAALDEIGLGNAISHVYKKQQESHDHHESD